MHAEALRLFQKHNLPAAPLQHAGERALDHLPRIRIGRRDVREVRLPHDVIDADQLAQLDADGLEPKVDIDLAAELLARPRLDPLGPQAPPLPFVVARFEYRAHPAETGLG